jgi:hypothetical protein
MLATTSRSSPGRSLIRVSSISIAKKKSVANQTRASRAWSTWSRCMVSQSHSLQPSCSSCTQSPSCRWTTLYPSTWS